MQIQDSSRSASPNRIKSEKIYYIHLKGFSDPINLTM